MKAKNRALEKKRIGDWLAKQEVPAMSDLLASVADYNLPLGKRKLLAVMMLPQSLYWSERQKYETAQISSHYFWQCKQDKAFLQMVKDGVRDQIGRSIPSVWHAFFRDALLGNPANQLAILQQAGIMDKPGGITINNSVNIVEIQTQVDENVKRGMGQFGFVMPDR